MRRKETFTIVDDKRFKKTKTNSPTTDTALSIHTNVVSNNLLIWREKMEKVTTEWTGLFGPFQVNFLHWESNFLKSTSVCGSK